MIPGRSSSVQCTIIIVTMEVLKIYCDVQRSVVCKEHSYGIGRREDTHLTREGERRGEGRG